MPEKGFSKPLILDLPAELRNQVYEIIAAEPGTVKIRCGRLLPHPLLRVSRLIRGEFKPIHDAALGELHPDCVEITIHNFDFDKTIGLLSACLAETPPRFTVLLQITKEYSDEYSDVEEQDTRQLLSWFKYLYMLRWATDSVETSYKVDTRSAIPRTEFKFMIVDFHIDCAREHSMWGSIDSDMTIDGAAAACAEFARIEAAFTGAVNELEDD